MVMRRKHYKAIELLVQSRLTFRQIAALVKVSERTLSRWVNGNETFRGALRACQERQLCRAEEMRDHGVAVLMAKVVDRINRDADDRSIPGYVSTLEKLNGLMKVARKRSS
jgi:hypothetical protein